MPHDPNDPNDPNDPHDHGHGHDHHDHGPDQAHHAHAHHAHTHSPGHVHAPANFGRAFAIGIALNTAYVLAEAGYGIAAHSLALLSDAVHNAGDVLGLAAAWGAARLAARLPSAGFTYGMRRSSILVALANAAVLLVATGGIAWEAIRRLASPAPVAAETIMVVAAIGIAVNGITAWLFASGRKGDLNIRAAFQHMLADALVAAGVVAGGALVLATGWLPLDPLIALAVSAVIVWGTWGLLRDATRLALDGVPPGIDAGAVAAHLATWPGVTDVHDLHIWPMSTTETALTVHLVRPHSTLPDPMLRAIRLSLRNRYGIGHATIQVETGDTPCACTLAHPHMHGA
jgi:cobalt-zinc-cadmium efflux system protein